MQISPMKSPVPRDQLANEDLFVWVALVLFVCSIILISGAF